MTLTNTDQRLSDQERIAYLTHQLQQAQALASLGELTGTATHEFNNVLMTILNYAKLGIRHKDEPTRDKALTKILAAAERAAKITRTILATARNRSDDFEPTDLASIIDDSLMLLERELRQYRVTVETDLQEVPAARANGNQIQRVLLNLVINARQAMPDGGTISIGLRSNPEANEVLLTVRDSGCGIPQEQLPSIFEPFFSTKSGPDASGKGGTGLGLSACRDIIQEHGGRIRVESTVGRGTAFIIRLPVASKTETAAA
ncbi:Wide host range VirA protein [Rosistilla carotiformis]|uniref:histidine kinase n=1 Tax=Rosistilla carotiformis TaxID=2528017 RepID=A0A518JYL3_9BACT|nr:ATP-binding protein [Rosistilla carotiformis]QDV70623.1 Wide host range VirA protein [Rosistilla carotiformis]